MDEELKLKIKSLLRRAGLARASKPVLVAICLGSILLVAFALWRFMPSTSVFAGDDYQAVVDTQDAGDEFRETESLRTVLVDVEGAVRNPGLYELTEGSRVGDAVEAAGGMTKNANQGQLNLAAVVEDGQQVLVPKRNSEAGESDQGNSISSTVATSTGSQPDGKININTASAEELQRLSGIGASLSQRIVDYRQANGCFKSVDELTEVSGIGDARLAAIRDSICV